MVFYFFISFFISIYTYSSHWAHEIAHLPKHPDFRYERLDNGFSYAWYPHSKKGSSCQIRLHVDVGSLQEEDHEQGMAHFLEHLAFKGNKYLSTDLIKTMQSLGLTFGAHSNAHTTYSETVYKFDLDHDCNKETLENMLLAVRGIADGLLLVQHEIEIEQGVVDAEEAMQLSPHAVRPPNIFNEISPEMARMNALGEKSVRHKFTANSVRQFYEKWYVPKAMKLMVVSGLDGLDAIMRDSVPKTFASMQPRDYLPRKILSIAKTNEVAIAQQKSDFPFVLSMQGHFQKMPLGVRDINGLITHEKRMIIAKLLEARLKQHSDDDVAKKDIILMEQEMVESGRAIEEMRSTRIPLLGIGLSVMTSAGDAIAENALFERIVEDALAHGFTAHEMHQAIEAYAKGITNNYEAHRDGTINALLNDARGFLAPLSSDQFTTMVTAEAKKITSTEAQALLKHLWSGRQASLFFGTIKLSSAQGILSAIEQAKAQVQLKPPTTSAPMSYADYVYRALAQGGTDFVQEFSDRSNVTKISFGNGLKLSIINKSADHSSAKNEFQITLKSPSSVTGPKSRKDQVIANRFMSSFENMVNIKNHTFAELKELFPEEHKSFYLNWNADGLRLATSYSNETQGRDLLKQLELLSGYFIDPQINKKQFATRKANCLAEISQFSETHLHDFQELVFGTNASCQKVVINAQDFATITEDDVMASLRPLLLDGPLEIEIFSSEPSDHVATLVAKTFGRLPTRKPALGLAMNTTKAPVMQSGIVKKITVPNLTAASVLMYYPLAQIIDLQDCDHTRDAAQVLKIIVKDRIQHLTRSIYGASYTLQADIYALKDGDMTDGVLKIAFDLKPEMVDQIMDHIVKDIHDLAEQGPTEEECMRAKAQHKSSAAQDLTKDQIKAVANQVVRRELVSYGVITPVAQ